MAALAHYIPVRSAFLVCICTPVSNVQIFMCAHLLAEVEAAPLSPLAAHATRVGQLAEACPVAEAALVAVASARHAHPEHLHVSLPVRVALVADVPRLLGSFVSGHLWKIYRNRGKLTARTKRLSRREYFGDEHHNRKECVRVCVVQGGVLEWPL